MPAKAIITQAKEKMNKSMSLLDEKLQSLRTGQASAQHYEHIMVECYGTSTPLNQLGNISVPEPRLVVIQPWDANTLPDIEKAITSSSLSVNPQSDGKLIRINVPPLTDETRQQNIKLAKDIGEEMKVAIRNVRREANEKLKKLENDHEISQDELKHHEQEIQNLTNDITSQVQQKVSQKEQEITEI